MFEEAQNGSSDIYSSDTVSHASEAMISGNSTAVISAPSNSAKKTASPVAETKPVDSADENVTSSGMAEKDSAEIAAEKLQLQFGSFGKPEDAGIFISLVIHIARHH